MAKVFFLVVSNFSSRFFGLFLVGYEMRGEIKSRVMPVITISYTYESLQVIV